MVGKYKPVEQIRSRDEQERLYRDAVREIETLKRAVSNENIVAKEFKHERDDLKTTNKRISKNLITMTKREELSKASLKSGMWSGAAGTTVSIAYLYWDHAGFPGGYNWESFWEHDQVFGLLMFVTTVVYGAVWKALHEG
jgi:hypothetical protein|tara:strand:- start:238 stop:657 length:420 start_codon:yes stop_codon:yes gene_type:complete